MDKLRCIVTRGWLQAQILCLYMCSYICLWIAIIIITMRISGQPTRLTGGYRTKFIEYPPWPFGSNLKLSVDNPKLPAMQKKKIRIFRENKIDKKGERVLLSGRRDGKGSDRTIRVTHQVYYFQYPWVSVSSRLFPFSVPPRFEALETTTNDELEG